MIGDAGMGKKWMKSMPVNCSEGHFQSKAQPEHGIVSACKKMPAMDSNLILLIFNLKTTSS